jgi:hypothetical protein
MFLNGSARPKSPLIGGFCSFPPNRVGAIGRSCSYSGNGKENSSRDLEVTWVIIPLEKNQIWPPRKPGKSSYRVVFQRESQP